MADDVLFAPYVLEYAYKRSVGPIIGRFLTGLREQRIYGVRCGARVIVPPTEYDPETGEDCGDFVEVAATGTVTTWAWVGAPRPNHPLSHAFATVEAVGHAQECT